MRLKDTCWDTSTALTDDNEPTDGGEGNVVMKASRSEAVRAAARADESNLPHARLQGQAPGGRWSRPSCGEGDAAGATWRGRRRRGPASFQRGGEHAAERTEQDSY